MMTRPRALTALTRFGLGPRPNDFAAIKSDPVDYVLQQCYRPASALITRDVLMGRPALGEGFARLDAEFRRTRRAEGQPDATDAIREMAQEARLERRHWIRDVYLNEIAARFEHGVATDDPFVERLVLFWSNHFAIETRKGAQLRFLAGNYEREAIRPNVLGYFSDMLVATTTHSAMLMYLDNIRSVGPNSRVGRRRGKVAVTENLAREVLELHTMGATGGYTQDDVIALANTLTGWTGGIGRGAGDDHFDERRHEYGPRTILGKTYTTEGPDQLLEVLPDLAAHPSTARHIAIKMAQHFVADGAPDALVDELTATFLDTDGDLREMALVLLESDLAWQGDPVKTVPPYDFMVGAMRATGGHFRRQAEVVSTARDLAQDVWSPPSPAGWPSEDSAFLGGDSLLERVDFARAVAQRYASVDSAQTLATALFGDALDPFVKEAVDRAEDQDQALVLLLMSPAFHRR